MKQRQYIIRQREDTRSLADRLAKQLPLPAVLALTGDLGTGKTAFIQDLGQALGATELLPSPTFTLINEYELPTGVRLIHADLYRLHSQSEIVALGLQDMMDEPQTVVAIEWADRLPALMPASTIWLHFELINDHRVITLQTNQESFWLHLEASEFTL